MSMYDDMVKNRESMVEYFKKAKANGFLPAFYSFDDYLILELMRSNYFEDDLQIKLLDFYKEEEQHE